MDSKICTHRKIEKKIEDFYNKYTECKVCNGNRSLKRYYEKKDTISNLQKNYFEKNREKILLQKQNKRCIQFRGLAISYVQSENRLKALEENLKNIPKIIVTNHSKSL